MFARDRRILTPTQDAETRKDQYWPKQTWNGAGDGSGFCQLDARNNVWFQQGQTTMATVQVVYHGGGILDSNGYYKVSLLDTLSGFPNSAITSTIMRLNTFGEVLREGDTAVAVWNSGTFGSPDPNDDNFLLLNLAVLGSIGYVREYVWIGTVSNDYQARPWDAIPVTPNVNEALTVSNATNAAPIVITTTTNHNLTTGDTVTIFGVLVNTNANVSGNAVTVLTPTTFSLNGTTGNGAYGGGGVCLVTLAPTITLPKFSDAEINDKVLVCALQRYTPHSLVLVEAFAGDVINGGTISGNLNDLGWDYTTSGTYGGSWEFIRSNNASIGWMCSRFLNT